MNVIRPPAASVHTPRCTRPARVVIADDESMFRTCLRQLLAVPPTVVKDVYGSDIGAGFEVIGESSSGEDTINTVRTLKPDLLLLDLCMPRRSGLDVLRELHRGGPATSTVILSGTLNKSQVLTAIQLGARGFVAKDCASEELFAALSCVVNGASWIAPPLLTGLMDVLQTRGQSSDAPPPAHPFGLTAREREVLTLVVEGCGNKEIASRLSVSEETIKHHLTRMFDKVGAGNRLELALAATRNDLVN